MGLEFSNYLGSLTRQLHLESDQERDIVRELEAHLEDKVSELQARGMDRPAAQELAERELGSPKALARGMYAVHSPGVWRDAALAAVPHFFLAALFALHLWSHFFWVALVLVVTTLVTWKNWRAGRPSKWSYSWLGYTLAAPALSWMLALMSLAYGGWTWFTTGQLPINAALFLLLIGYVPFSMWVTASVACKVIKRDWLLASLTSLPFPFLTSWVLFLNWQGGWWGDHTERMQETDTARAMIFLALAVTTAVFLRVGPRLVKIGLLTVATAVLVVITAASLPVSFSFLALLLMTLASLAFLLSPAMLDSHLSRRQDQHPVYPGGDDELTTAPP